jgi:iron complex outermembrane receptor protein
MNLRSQLLLASATFALLSGTAHAADAAPAPADVVPAEAGADADAEPGEIVVFGRGQARQVQEISQEDLRVQAPGSSPLKAISKLPSVNFQSADPFGNYEWSQRISIRGFNQNQLGYTLDGIPLGDFSYGNVNGLHISRAISPENIGSTRVTQGAGSLGTNATNNLGGTIEFVSRAPSENTAVDVEATYGSDETKRGFVRFDTGGDKVRGYLSYGYLGLNKWKGVGEQNQHMVNAKIVADMGGPIISGIFSFSDRRETDYQDLSLDMIRRLGLRNDNIGNNFPLALQIAQVGANRGDTGVTPTNPAAGTVYPAPYSTVDDVYYDAAGLRQDYVAGLTVDAPFSESLNGSLSTYFHSNHGMGLWWTPYVASPSGSPISQRTTEYDIRRGGLFGKLAWTRGPNTLTVGGWWENNHFHQARRYYAVNPAKADQSDHLKFPSSPFRTDWDFRFVTHTYQYFVEDRVELGDLTLTAGAKGFRVSIDANPVKAGVLAQGRIVSRDWLQPSAGAVYKIGEAELYAGFSQVTRAFTGASTSGPFATTQAGFDSLDVKPEKSDTYEAGVRFRHGALSGTAGGYYAKFRNRLLSFSNGAGIIGNPPTLQNVGGVESYGFETALQYRLMGAVSLLATYSYNHSTYEDNVFNANGTIRSAIKGKTLVDTPEHLAKGEIVYDDGAISARIGADYMSRRYFTYTNDQSVGGRVLFDASVGYTFRDGFLDGLELRASATNLFDKKYIATIGSNGFGDAGDNQTLLAGAPQSFFFTVKKVF